MRNTVYCTHITISHKNTIKKTLTNLSEFTDIVGVVLFVEEEPRKIEARDGKRESFVREIVVTDERLKSVHLNVQD